jgi:hypothetical protein
MTVLAKRLVELAKMVRANDQERMKVEAADATRRALADKLLASMEARDYVTAEELAVLSPALAAKAVKKGFSRVKKSSIVKADMTEEQRLEAARKAGKENPEMFCGWLRSYGPKV